MKKLFSTLILTLMLAAQPAWADSNPNDPYEAYNRVMFSINTNIDKAVLTPVAKGYRAVTPAPVRRGVSNFFNNLRDLYSFGSNLLRLDIEKAGTDIVRFGLNSTFGLGGLLDIATEAQIPSNKSTLGDTFASWGWKNSNYFVYPIVGPSTVRDAVGGTIAIIAPADGYILRDKTLGNSARVVGAIGDREALLDLTESAEEAAVDHYAYIRDAYMAYRSKAIIGSLPYGEVDDFDIDDLVAPEEGFAASMAPVHDASGHVEGETSPAMAATEAEEDAMLWPLTPDTERFVFQ
ncbi:MAG: VacJ family lipoprotein [Neisseriaceae bacterium]|nr:VacJ family lipoprotein [Neisseriaceae bacterium]